MRKYQILYNIGTKINKNLETVYINAENLKDAILQFKLRFKRQIYKIKWIK